MTGRDPRGPRARNKRGQAVTIDVFCGAGGMSLGLRKAGMRVVCGIEIDPLAAASYSANVGAPVIREDVRAVQAHKLRSYVPRGSRLVLAVCAPCQPFSKIRRGKKSRRRERDLLLSVMRLIRALKPDGVIVENVPQISTDKRGSVLNMFCSQLDQAGYSHCSSNLDAKHFGVPQTRRRMVLFAVRGRGRAVALPARNGVRPRTVRDTIAALPRIKAGDAARGLPLHRSSGLSPRNVQRIRQTPHDGGDLRDVPRRLKPPCHLRSGGFYDVYGRMRWDGPAPTLTTRCDSLSNGRFGHPEQDRAISLLEAALLQTFPRSCRFVGNKRAVASQIGNAVPVELARALGTSLLRQL